MIATDTAAVNAQKLCTQMTRQFCMALFCLVVVTGVLIALIRSTFAISIDVATTLAVPLTLILSFRLTQFCRTVEALPILCCALVGAIFSFTLWQSRYLGMPVMGGADAANHLIMRAAFISSDAHAYSGFTVLYGISVWLERIGIGDPFDCFRAIVYCVPPLFFGIIGIGLQLAARRVHVQTLTFCCLLALVSWYALLPRFHYFQCDGFFGNIISLVPIALLWVSWSFSSSLCVRMLLSIAALIVLRFTYGLNLGDLCLTIAFVILLEPIARSTRYFFSLCFFACAAYCYVLLTPIIWQSSGGIIAYGVTRDAVAISLLAFILLFLIDAPDDARLNRSRLFCGIFALVSTNAALIYRLTTPLPQYYVFKYLFACSFILSLTTLLHIFESAPRLLRTNALRLLIICCCFGLSIWMQQRSLAPYRRSLSERFSAGPHQRFVQPLLQRSVLSAIQEKLRIENKEFGGYLTGSWPQAAFINALLNRPLGLAQFRSGDLQLDQQHCIFWNASGATITALRARSAETAIAQIALWRVDPASTEIATSEGVPIGVKCG